MPTQSDLINVKVPWDEDVKDVIVDFPDFISKLLLCNSPPTDEELPLVTGYLQEAIETLFALQEDLRPLDQSGGELADIPEQVIVRPHSTLLHETKKIDAARIILSPVRNTPAEIVEEIALICCAEPPNLDAPLAARFPMLLCRVSSQWRRSIESSTRLWTHIRCNPGVGKNTEFFESTFQKYTVLAATTPIYLELVLTPTRQYSSHGTERFASRTIHLLTLWTGRSQMTSLSIDFGLVGVNPFMKIAGQMRFGTLPNLQMLLFSAPHQSSAVTIFKQIFMDTPGLRQLRLEADHSHSNFDILPQSMMRSLTQVDMKGKYFAPGQWMLIMVGCSKLQTASFDLEGISPHFEQAIRITELRELTTLSLNYLPTCHFNPHLPFRWMSFPRLTTLNISFNSPSLPRLRMMEIPYQPKLPRLTHLSIIANISRGMWGIDDDGEPDPSIYTDPSLEDMEDLVRRLLTLARKDLDSLQLSLSAPPKIWREIFKIWTGVYESPSALDTREIPAMKSLHLGIPAEVILRAGESLLQLVVRQINHPRCRLEHLRVTVGIKQNESLEIVDQSIDVLWKGLEAYVTSNQLSWERDVLRYRPALARRNVNQNAMR